MSTLSRLSLIYLINAYCIMYKFSKQAICLIQGWAIKLTIVCKKKSDANDANEWLEECEVLEHVILEIKC